MLSFAVPKTGVVRSVNVILLHESENGLDKVKQYLDSINAASYTIAEYDCLEDAKDRLAEEETDVCLVDYQSAGKLALSLLDFMKEKDINCPCLVISNDSEASVEDQLLERGAVDFWQDKDLNAKVLEHSIRSACHRHYVIDQYREESSRMATHLRHMAHELKTPLSAISGFTQLSKKHLRDGKPEKIEQTIEPVLRNAGYINSLINELLDLAHLEQHDLTLELFELHIGAIAHHICEDLQPYAQEHGLVLNAEFEEDFGRAIKGDPNRIRQIVSNLISNALKYTDEGFVNVRLVEAHDEVKGEGIELLVEDTGIGISPQDFAALFDEFKRINHRTKKTVDSTGLGLPITYELVKLHGGYIQVESNLGKGSCFKVFLPCDPAQG